MFVLEEPVWTHLTWGQMFICMQNKTFKSLCSFPHFKSWHEVHYTGRRPLLAFLFIHCLCVTYWMYCSVHCVYCDSTDWALFTGGQCAWMYFSFGSAGLSAIHHACSVCKNCVLTNKSKRRISCELLQRLGLRSKLVSDARARGSWFDYQALFCDIWEVHGRFQRLKLQHKYSLVWAIWIINSVKSRRRSDVAA